MDALEREPIVDQRLQFLSDDPGGDATDLCSSLASHGPPLTSGSIDIKKQVHRDYWTLVEKPDAILYDALGHKVGRHFAATDLLYIGRPDYQVHASGREASMRRAGQLRWNVAADLSIATVAQANSKHIIVLNRIF